MNGLQFRKAQTAMNHCLHVPLIKCQPGGNVETKSVGIEANAYLTNHLTR